MPRIGTMNRRNRNQSSRPKMLCPPMRIPFTFIAGTCMTSTMRSTTAMTTGPPTINARNTVRRDHSISPSERSNTRSADAQSVGIVRFGVAASSLFIVGRSNSSFARRSSLLDQVLEHGLQVVVGRGALVARSRLARGGQLSEPRVERLGPAGLDDQRAWIELEAQDVVVGQELP